MLQMGDEQTLADICETDLLADIEDEELQAIMDRASVGLLQVH